MCSHSFTQIAIVEGIIHRYFLKRRKMLVVALSQDNLLNHHNMSNCVPTRRGDPVQTIVKGIFSKNFNILYQEIFSRINLNLINLPLYMLKPLGRNFEKVKVTSVAFLSSIVK